MFGLGREARVRREAAKCMQDVMQTEQRLTAAVLQQLGSSNRAADTPSDCTALVERLMVKASKSSMGQFAGKRLPSLTGIGLALETLYHGVDDFGVSPPDRRLIVHSLQSLLAAAAQRKDQLNDADFEMLNVIAGSYERHPRIAEILNSPA